MYKYMKKTITGSLLSAAMLATTVCSAIAPMSASAEIPNLGTELLGATTFDDNIGLPWHTCESNSAKQTFDINDGKYQVRILNNFGGDGRWDLQFRHKGIQLVNGHKYHIHAEITCSADAYLYTKIGNYAGNKEYWNDAGNGNWQPVQLKKGQTFVIDTDFTAGSGPSALEDGPAEWDFQYACHKGTDGAAQYGGDDTGVPNGATITFDNLSIQDLSDDAVEPQSSEYGIIKPKSNVRLNQVGYFTKLSKKASYTTDASEPLEFTVYDKSDKPVLNGKSILISDDVDSGTPETVKVRGDGGKLITRYKDSGKYVHILDFSKLSTAGDGYYIIVKDKVGVSGTQFCNNEGAFDTKLVDDKLMWTNWKTSKEYQMNRSHPFKISNDVYGDLVRDSVSYFYQNRSGVPIEGKYIKNGDASKLEHSKEGHNPDKAYVQSAWVKHYSSEFDGDKDYSITATGGWYDAENHGKNVVNGGISVWTLQNLYEMSLKLGTEKKWNDAKTMLIPENSNGKPDLLDEARVELEWFFDMIVKGDDPYWGDEGSKANATGLVYHKIQDSKWTGLALYAWDYGEYEKGIARIAKPPTYAATFNTIACAAQAARLWRGIDDEFADKCLNIAKDCLAAVEKHKSAWSVKEGDPLEQDDTSDGYIRGNDPLFAPLDQAVVGEPYGDTYVEDDYYWALCELFATTGEDEYLTKLRTYENKNDVTGSDKAFGLTYNLVGGENRGSCSSFNWGCTSGLGTLSLYLNSDKLSSDDAKTVEDSIIQAADKYIELEKISGMGIPYVGFTYTDEVGIGLTDEGNPIEINGYENGSNSYVVNNAMVMAYAYEASGRKYKYLDGASTAMDYLFGRNGNDFSYISGYGDTEMDTVLKYPHHRYWAGSIDANFPLAPAGVLSGGPNAGMQDNYMGGVGFKRGTVASQKCYVDSAEAWSVNGVNINWNAPLVWMASYLEDVAGNKNPDPTGVWGDANMSGEVKMNDAVLIMQAASNSDEYGIGGTAATAITEEGSYWGDVYDHKGGDITNMDAVMIQKYLVQTIKSLEPEIK